MHWTTFVVASIPACAAIVAAALAALSAGRTKRLETEAQHVRDLESRLADQKYATYKPMIDLLTKITDPEAAKSVQPKTMSDQFSNFDAWVAIYGSDAAVTAWHRFRQAMFFGPPSTVVLRLYGEFVLAARQDMGRPDTSASLLELIGTRINDLYTNATPDLKAVLEVDWPEIATRTGWSPPWL